MKKQTPEAILAGFEKRVDAMFRAESGTPLVRAKKQKPLGPGRGNYVMGISGRFVPAVGTLAAAAGWAC